MAVVRKVLPVIVGALLSATQAGAQGTGNISGKVVDSASAQPLVGVQVTVDGTDRRGLTREDGGYMITGVSEGSHVVRARRIGYAGRSATVSVSAASTATADFALAQQVAALSEVVVTGYGTQRREAISGSVSTVDADAANVGVITNANQMLQGRVAGVQMVTNSGEPGAGAQIRIRGGTSISASNDPLYVIDGVPMQNESIAPDAPGIASINSALPRSPLNSINPDDIESITVLKDASATAIYGSRGANGVVLIQTKKTAGVSGQMEYQTYIAAASPSKSLGLMTGSDYDKFVRDQYAIYKADSTANPSASGWAGLPATAVASLGGANTDWEKAIERTGIATNHDLSFSGGSSTTQYRASLNYFKQEGVIISNGLERYQGRINGSHDAFSGRLRMNLNLMAARVVNDYAPYENTGGFLGGLFTNMVIMNPTKPVTCANVIASDVLGTAFCSGKSAGDYYQTGSGAIDVKNPVGMANQWDDVAPENRVLGNLTGSISLREDLTAQTTLGIDYTNAVRRTFAPRLSPVGAQYNGYARQAERDLQDANFQQLLTYTPHMDNQEIEVVGGYEYTAISNRGFDAQMQGFITDAFGVNNLAAGTQASSPAPTSYLVDSKLASFFSRANYGYKGKYYLTGVIRYDGSSRLAEGHQWATFPAIGGTWRLSEEDFFKGGMFSTLALRAGWGKQGNQSISPYETKLLLRADPGAVYPIGNVLTTGLRAAQVGNPDLKWETAEQVNVGLDWGLANERFTGVLDVYQKTTHDLLLEVDVPQPAVVQTRFENIGSLRNRGVEATFNTPLISRGSRSLSLELVGTFERNKLISLGDTARKYINTGFVSGQGQSGQYSQRIAVGQPIPSFFAPVFLRVETTGSNKGKQVFSCVAASAGCVNGETFSPTDADRQFVGSANPDFTLGLSNRGGWDAFDFSWLWRGEFGGKVFNNTALVYQTKSDALQGRNFLKAALNDPDALSEPAKFSTRWIEDRTFVRLQNLTLGYTVPTRLTSGHQTRVFVSGDNLLLLSGYSGYDPEVYSPNGLASRGMDYLTYPRARTFTLGARAQF
ncbi:MAG TPA: SusC/RagA family TonB-linked outer membrane protein [Gemmatimonadaceae bacterium]|nr:SusC/RagA family TonB-linked outer membrane protein [Gemmatimonadaceae bacterium]